MKEIQLSQGKVALVDDEDHEQFRHLKWYFHNRGYAARKNGGKTIFLHNDVMNVVPDQRKTGKTINTVDHIDRDLLNNTKANLRLVSHSVNCQNGPMKGSNTSGYRGVILDKRRGTWFAAIRVNGGRKFFTGFTSPKDAAHAYDKAAREFFGPAAAVNFPDKV